MHPDRLTSSVAKIRDLLRAEFPGAKVYVRTWDRRHTLELLAKGVDYELRETFESALAFGAETLRGIGFTVDEADEVVAEVRRRDADRLAVQLRGDQAAGVAAVKPQDVTPEPLSAPPRRDGSRRGEATAPEPERSAAE